MAIWRFPGGVLVSAVSADVQCASHASALRFRLGPTMAVLPKYPCLRADNTLGAESLSMGVAAPKGGCGPW